MFKDIPDTNGAYSCDENGNVRSNERLVYNKGSGRHYVIRERILNQYQNNKGYWYVDLRINNKTVRYLVSRLVATTWIPNPHNYPIINHKDNNPSNNCVDNLEWCTYQYNNEYSVSQGRHNYYTQACIKAHHANKKYLHKPVDQFDLTGFFVASYPSITEAAAAINTSFSNSRKGNISACCHGKAKSAYGYIWRFKSNENVTTNYEVEAS